jgi:5-methyltetrahydropteroyltriglutamate--homocysteine methyltransferase
MRWSDERILTTHTGSLPRPPELTRLYVRRARGEAIDRAELDRVGKAALQRIVDKQIEPVSISATTASSNARRFFSTSGIG